MCDARGRWRIIYIEKYFTPGGLWLVNMSFFAASNSADGFKNYYERCFERADRLYIVKGGPGTGKSTLMKRVADIAESLDMAVERYYCSSDHTSLDGVLFNCGGRWTGVLDGTYPHPYIERLPAVREEIVNLGEFWDADALRAQGEHIRMLCAQKGRMYDAAYSYLRACGGLHDVYGRYCGAEVDREKMRRWLSRICRGVSRGDGYRELPAVINSVGMTGQAHMGCLEDAAMRIYMLVGECGKQELLDEVLSMARELGSSVRVAIDPIYCREKQGIFFEDAMIWIVCEEALPEEAYEIYMSKVRRINMRRFCSAGIGGEYKEEKKSCTALIRGCVSGALGCLEAAGRYHFELEEIYKAAMDFEGLGRYTDEVCRRIFI